MVARMNGPFDIGGTTQVLQLSLTERPRVLLVDDDELVLERLHGLIRGAGFDVQTAADGAAALETLQHSFAPIVITDRQMPGIDGLTLCRTIRHNNWPGYVYILLLTTQDAEEDILAGLDAGADDYVSKRTSTAHLLARLRTARRILGLEHSLKQALAEKRRLALTDPLTGAANHRHFMDRLTRELESAQELRNPVSLLCLDLDHFKGINDRHGHAAGDAVLQEVVHRINRCLRPHGDWCARIGGEEFAVVLADTDPRRAGTIAERIRVTLADQPIATANSTISTTVSIGLSGWCAEIHGLATSAESLLQQGDEALYASKAAGRNCITVAKSLAQRLAT